jgi:hypothetical protein
MIEGKLHQAVCQMWRDSDRYRGSLLSAAQEQMEQSREAYRILPEIVTRATLTA